MERLRKFFRVPSLCISLAVFIAFAIILIVTSIGEYSLGTYSYHESMAGQTIQSDLVLEKNNQGYCASSWVEGGRLNFDHYYFKYQVIGGHLFISQEGISGYRSVGEINAFKIVSQDEYHTAVAVNRSAIALAITSGILIAISLVGVIMSSKYIHSFKARKNEERLSANKASRESHGNELIDGE